MIYTIHNYNASKLLTTQFAFSSADMGQKFVGAKPGK